MLGEETAYQLTTGGNIDVAATCGFGCVRPPRCGIVLPVSRENLPVFMRPLSRILRLTAMVIAVLGPGLLLATPAEAAHRPKDARRVLCDPRTPPRHVLARVALKTRVAPAQAKELGLRFQRAHGLIVGDDDDAIQNDAPAVRFDVGDGVAPLEAIGLLASSRVSRPIHRIAARRSPRGPPAA